MTNNNEMGEDKIVQAVKEMKDTVQRNHEDLVGILKGICTAKEGGRTNSTQSHPPLKSGQDMNYVDTSHESRWESNIQSTNVITSNDLNQQPRQPPISASDMGQAINQADQMTKLGGSMQSGNTNYNDRQKRSLQPMQGLTGRTSGKTEEPSQWGSPVQSPNAIPSDVQKNRPPSNGGPNMGQTIGQTNEKSGQEGQIQHQNTVQSDIQNRPPSNGPNMGQSIDQTNENWQTQPPNAMPSDFQKDRPPSNGPNMGQTIDQTMQPWQTQPPNAAPSDNQNVPPRRPSKTGQDMGPTLGQTDLNSKTESNINSTNVQSSDGQKKEDCLPAGSMSRISVVSQKARQNEEEWSQLKKYLRQHACEMKLWCQNLLEVLDKIEKGGSESR